MEGIISMILTMHVEVCMAFVVSSFEHDSITSEAAAYFGEHLAYDLY